MTRVVSARTNDEIRPKSARRPQAQGMRRRSLIARLGATIGRRPGATLALVAVLACTGAISWNALMQQSGRHPAPLFGWKAERTPAEKPRRLEAALAPLPVPRPDPVAAPVSAGPPQVQKASAIDPIGAMIRSADGPARSDDVLNDAHRVATAQRALTKLGYGPLKPDGLIGATTRQALEHFERDRNLPATGQLGGRTSRQLASQSGLEID